MSAEARELQLFIDNDGDLHRQQFVPIVKNLMTKHAQGRYNSALAVKLFKYLTDAGAKKYAKEHGSGAADWNKIFSVADRKKAAESMRDDFEEEARTGNYDDYIPKKYRGKVSGKTIGEGAESSGEVFTEDQRRILQEVAVVSLEEASTKSVLKAISALHGAKGECMAALEGLGAGRKATRDYAMYQAVVEALDKSLVSAERARKLLSRA